MHYIKDENNTRIKKEQLLLAEWYTAAIRHQWYCAW